MQKKGASLPMTILVVAIILLVVLFVYLGIFQGLFKKEGGQINNQIDGLGDYDGDGVVNSFDKCCCDFAESSIDGCPNTIKPSTQTKDCSKCKK